MWSWVLGSLIVVYLILVILQYREYKEKVVEMKELRSAINKIKELHQIKQDQMKTFKDEHDHVIDVAWDNVVQISEYRKQLEQKDMAYQKLIHKKSNRRKKKVRGKRRKA
ncbi:hypothetical protein [Alkalihalophilus marmarensis]|uniref:Uncharacterized protein n=1 Tax=Alkalihalophilus marmarensis DSM 21297 TaxID=1188261 RepID=U6SPP0_9BACI|nr:hypothetical protein [Alkalihalophilus marmarensis]ERN52845.1 hypothetical protein A33I_14230 [Alkalihalophilus marmarensis DSM 21297]